MDENQNCYKLLDTDYENIWLRIKEKVWKWFIAIILLWGGIITAALGISIYKFINDIAKEAALTYVEGKEFKDELNNEATKAAESSFTQLKVLQNQIDTLQTKISTLQNTALGMQTAINDKAVVLTDKNGSTCRIEAGETTSQNVKFSTPFFQKPIVIATVSDCNQLLDKHHSCEVKISKITKDGFVVLPSDSMTPLHYNWVAIQYNAKDK